MKNFLSLFREWFDKTKAESESAQFGRDARFDWKAIIFLFLLLNIVFVIASFFMYAGINKGEIFLVDKKEQASLNILNTFELEKAVAFFEGKRERFEALKQEFFRTADPYTAPPEPKKSN